MGSVFGIILILLILGQPKDKRGSEMMKNLMRLTLGLVVVSALFPLISDLVGLAAIGGIGYYLYKKYMSKKGEQARRKEYGWNPQDRSTYSDPGSQRGPVENRNPYSSQYGSATYRRTENSNSGTYGNGYRTGSYHTNTRGPQPNNTSGSYSTDQQHYTTLPSAASKRRKIVESFNERNELFLTEEQITSIVNSSYMSLVWKKELEAMNCKYETIHQWFQGSTGWLRIYMHAFHVQEITSDIQQQEDIVIYAFETVFNYVDTLKNMSLSQKITEVNNYFMTSFDDISFMTVYRYLEAKGLKHDLGQKDVLRNEDSAEDLVKKYESL